MHARIRPGHCEDGRPLPYRRSRTLLSEFLPLGKPQILETTRQRTLRVGARLEQEAVARGGAKPAMAAKTITLSIDGGHAQAARQYQGRSFEVLLAQVSNDKRNGWFLTAELIRQTTFTGAEQDIRHHQLVVDGPAKARRIV
jgi:hypothetical protein